MKNAFVTAIGVLMGLTALTAEAHTPAREEAIYLADSMVDTLQDVEDLAASLAQHAERRGHYADAHAYGNLADSANALGQKVQRQVAGPLLRGQTFAYAKAQLSRIVSAFNLVDADTAELDYVPADLADLLDELKYLKRDLEDVLDAGDRGRTDRDDRPVRDGGRTGR